MRVNGYIVRRRCIGKKLAFADIQLLEDEEIPYNGGDNDSIVESGTQALEALPSGDSLRPRVIQAVFERDSSEWDIEFDSSFPSKNSKLPYGGKVSLEICPENLREDVSTSDTPTEGNSSRNASFHVRQWELLDHPREKALAEAQSVGTDGISCSAYLKSRGDAFLRFNGNTRRSQPNDEPRFKANSGPKKAMDFSHGDHRAKALRANIFALWLLETFGQSYLQAHGGVLDIAGGKGKLSIELALQGMIKCTIVDPVVRKHGVKLEPRDAKRIQKAEAPHPHLISKFFNTTTFIEDDSCRQLLDNVQLYVGLHPDECTEEIVDVALQCNKPFAVVPCCVFTGFFPLRRVVDASTGERVSVQTYEQLLDYLIAKDERIQRASLPFEGRNIVLYRLP